MGISGGSSNSSIMYHIVPLCTILAVSLVPVVKSCSAGSVSSSTRSFSGCGGSNSSFMCHSSTFVNSVSGSCSNSRIMYHSSTSVYSVVGGSSNDSIMYHSSSSVYSVVGGSGSGHTFLQPRLMTIAPAASPQKSVGHV